MSLIYLIGFFCWFYSINLFISCFRAPVKASAQAIWNSATVVLAVEPVLQCLRISYWKGWAYPIFPKECVFSTQGRRKNQVCGSLKKKDFFFFFTNCLHLTNETVSTGTTSVWHFSMKRQDIIFWKGDTPVKWVTIWCWEEFKLALNWALTNRKNTQPSTSGILKKIMFSVLKIIYFMRFNLTKIPHREHKDKFLPAHVRRTSWSWLPISGKNSPEVRLLEHYKRIPNNMSDRRLIRKYLEFCWSLPYYGWANWHKFILSDS